MPKLNAMAKSSTRRVTIFINGKEVEASVKQIRSEMNKLVNEQNRMVIGSDEYIAHAKKIKEHAQNIGSAASAWTEMYNKVLQFVEAADMLKDKSVCPVSVPIQKQKSANYICNLLIFIAL